MKLHLALLSTVVLAAAVLSGCAGGESAPTSTATPTAPPTLSPTRTPSPSPTRTPAPTEGPLEFVGAPIVDSGPREMAMGLAELQSDGTWHYTVVEGDVGGVICDRFGRQYWQVETLGNWRGFSCMATVYPGLVVIPTCTSIEELRANRGVPFHWPQTCGETPAVPNSPRSAAEPETLGAPIIDTGPQEMAMGSVEIVDGVIYYTVVEGDVGGVICDRFGRYWWQLEALDFNRHFSCWDAVYPGMILIPTCTVPGKRPGSNGVPGRWPQTCVETPAADAPRNPVVPSAVE